MRPIRLFAKLLCVVCTLGASASNLWSEEPNESFATSTILSAGTLSVSDSLTPGVLNQPDTLLAVRNASGVITQTDDDSSTLGNGTASGVMEIPTNSGAISFSVSGTGDVNFSGNHSETGEFDVEIEVFDFQGDLISSFFSGVRDLQPGAVEDFSFSGNPDWVGGTYNANVDNGLSDPSGGDVDFFTFTGLVAGASFKAQTSDPSSGINTFLFQYDSSGNVVAADDNGGADQFSLLEGIVPSDAQLTFAVTGFGDTFREGEHTEDGAYSLSLEIDTGIASDFDNSGTVDNLDLGIWQAGFGSNSGGDSNDDGDSDGLDFLVWQRQFGDSISALASVSAIPEPSSSSLLLFFAGLLSAERSARRRF